MNAILLYKRFRYPNWTIGAKLRVGFGLMLLFITGIAVSGLFNLLLVQRAVDSALDEGLQIEALGSRIQKALSAARRQEQAFLLRWQDEGYENAVNNYLIPHGNQISDIRLAITELEDLAASGAQEILVDTNMELAELSTALQIYRDEFNLVTSLLRERGTNYSGVIGDMENVGLALEDEFLLFGKPELINGYLQLRLNEKQYRLLGEPKYREQVDLALQEMRTVLVAQPLADAQRLTSLLDEYEKAFNELVRLNTEISNHTELYTAAADVIQPMAVVIAADGADLAEEDLNSVATSTQRARAGLMSVVILSMALGALLSIVLTRQISRPLRALTDVATEIGQGNLDIAMPQFGQDEVGILAATFRDMVSQLRESFATLEERVATRTQRLEIVATLGERLSAILNLDELLTEVVNQIRDKFDYYHAHIYLLDDDRKRLVVAAGTGEAGAEMKAKGHNIPLDASTSLVARTARTGEIVTVDNVREAKDWLPNPLLPDTHSEMAVPIILEGQIVGVLDVQQNEIAGLDEGDANLLRSLANQVAVAMRNARLFNEVEMALAEARAAQERYLEQAWQKAKIMARKGQYHYTRSHAPVLAETVVAEAKQQALAQNQPTIVTLNDNRSNRKLKSESRKPIVAPITFHGKAIGALQLHPASEGQTWSEDDLTIVEAVIDQLAQSAENLRLFEEARERAGREQIIREITDKLRAASNVDSLLQIAARELGQRLGVRHTVLELGVESEPPLAGDMKNGQDNG